MSWVKNNNVQKKYIKKKKLRIMNKLKFDLPSLLLGLIVLAIFIWFSMIGSGIPFNIQISIIILIEIITIVVIFISFYYVKKRHSNLISQKKK